MFFGKKDKKDEQKPVDEIIANDEFYQKGVATVRGLLAPSALQINSDNLQIGGIMSTTLFVVAYPR